MNISKVKLYKYSLPLNRPLFIRNKKLENRDGIILQLISDQAKEGFGEVAPLPNFSQESLEDAIDQLRIITPFLLGEPVPNKVEKLDKQFSQWLKNLSLLPSVQCGVETAVLHLLANTKGITLNRLLSKECRDMVRINAMIQGSKAEVTKEAQSLIQNGFSAIKLKVGSKIDEEIKKVQAVNEIVNGKALLHLDANQSWDLNMAVKFDNEVGCATIDYIEEPFEDPEEISQLFLQTTIPSALDESLTQLAFDKIKSIDGVDMVILKPMILGGVEKIWQIKREAKRFAIETSISSSFESDIGILTLAHLAGAYTRDNYAGLDTLKWFGQKLLKKPLTIDKGRMNIKGRCLTSKEIDFGQLSLI